MAPYPVDLHTHTTASDGTHSPTELIKRAAQRGLQVLGISDHDTIDGVLEAQNAGQKVGIEVVAGVEFSLRHEYEKDFVGIHLLGYFFDPTYPLLIQTMKKVYQGRVEQKIKQIEILQSFGFDISVEEVFARVEGVPGRPHIAAVLMERNGDKFETLQQIYDEYLGLHAQAHVGRQFALTLSKATRLIKAAGGLTVMAHPGLYQKIDPIFALKNAQKEGVEGVEVYYPYESGRHPSQDNGSSWIGRLEAVAHELNLLQTGGTDFHGRSKEIVDLGDMGLTLRQFKILKQGWQQLRA